MADAHKNFSVSTVATAPSPATSGTSLVVATGEGVRFPTAPFNAVVWPTSVSPLPTNAEIVRVTTIATDTFTIARQQESTSARTIVVGDQIMAAITLKTLTDAETVPSYQVADVYVAQDTALLYSGDVLIDTDGFYYIDGALVETV